MFSKAAFFFTVLAAAFANPKPASQCSTGPVQCCNSSGTIADPDIVHKLGVVGAVVTDVNVLIGVDCSPITVVGAGSGATCSAQPFCCENNNFNGVVAIGCVPVDLNLK